MAKRLSYRGLQHGEIVASFVLFLGFAGGFAIAIFIQVMLRVMMSYPTVVFASQVAVLLIGLSLAAWERITWTFTETGVTKHDTLFGHTWEWKLDWDDIALVQITHSNLRLGKIPTALNVYGTKRTLLGPWVYGLRHPRTAPVLGLALGESGGPEATLDILDVFLERARPAAVGPKALVLRDVIETALRLRSSRQESTDVANALELACSLRLRPAGKSLSKLRGEGRLGRDELLVLAEIDVIRRHYGEAEAVCDELLKSTPDDYWALLCKALCRWRLGTREEARSLIDRLADADGRYTPIIQAFRDRASEAQGQSTTYRPSLGL